MSKVDIRPMTQEEDSIVAEAWWGWLRAAFPWQPVVMSHTLPQTISFFRAVVSTQNKVWVASDQERILAMIAFSDSEVDQLYVAPEAQGRGLGSRLLSVAKGASDGALRLYTFQANRNGRAFYANQGFKEVVFGMSPPPENEPDVLLVWAPPLPVGADSPQET